MWEIRRSINRFALRLLCFMHKLAEVALEALAVFVREGRGTFGPAALTPDLLLLMPDEHHRVDRERVVDASAHADGACPAAEHDIGKSYVLRDDDVFRRDGRGYSEVGRIGADAFLEGRGPEAAVWMLRISRLSRVLRPHMALEVLRRVAGDDAGNLFCTGYCQALTYHGAGICIDVDFRHAPHSFSSLPSWHNDNLPGATDNFASNEIIVCGITAAEVFENLIDTAIWPTYYDNATDVEFDSTEGTKLAPDTRFRFKTFGFPIEAQVIEFEAPADGKPGRLAWHGWAEGDVDHRLDVVHAWLLEDLSEGRVRILTQESQKGKPAAELFESEPDTMDISHQKWVKGLARTVLAAKAAKEA